MEENKQIIDTLKKVTENLKLITETLGTIESMVTDLHAKL